MSKQRRILCIGMCVLDVVHVCAKFPEEDTDRRCLRGHWQRGGNASNNCTVLRNLGAECEFFGILSSSEGFQFLLNDCHKRKIHIEKCPTVGSDPPFSSVILNQENDSRTIIHSNPNFPILTYEHFKSIITDLELYHWIHFEARNPNETSKMIDDIVEFNSTREDKIKISVEQEKILSKNLILTQNVDYVFLGKDLAKSLNWDDPKTAVLELKKLFSNNNHLNLICSWGSNGAVSLDSNGELEMIPAFPPDKIVDALGAGDTFCAAVIYALSNKNMNIRKSVEFGNKIAGAKLGFFGYDQLTKCDVENMLQ